MRMAFGDLRVSWIALARRCIVVNSLIVIVDGHREHLLRVVLTDHVLV